MRRVFGIIAVAVMLAGSGVASAQLIDPSTGVMVDATTDPMDFSAVASGQPGNVGTEMAAQAAAQAHAFADQQMQAAMQSAAQTNDIFPANDDSNSQPVAVVPKTPKPAMTPNGGSFHNSVQVTISDKDRAAMIHYTTDGSKPTLSSPIFVSPLTVTTKTKVQALADDGTELPSSIVSKTFKIKS